MTLLYGTRSRESFFSGTSQGGREGLALFNAESFLHPYGVPTVLVSSHDGPLLAAAAAVFGEGSSPRGSPVCKGEEFRAEPVVRSGLDLQPDCRLCERDERLASAPSAHRRPFSARHAGVRAAPAPQPRRGGSHRTGRHRRHRGGRCAKWTTCRTNGWPAVSVGAGGECGSKPSRRRGGPPSGGARGGSPR